jgi:hypothetical protein
MKQVFDAAMRVHRSQERIRELRESLEQCEPVKAWRDRNDALRPEDGLPVEDIGPEPEFCAKRAPLHDTEPHFSFAADGSDYWEAMRYLTPDEVPAFIAEHWCAACQRNSPKVVEIRALKRALGSHRGTLTKACRKAAKGG